jgi:predicted MFS family arabinose efflux permease
VFGLVGRAAAYRFLDTFVLIFPFYTVMFTEHGMSPAQIGLALAAWSLTGVALEIPTGALADRLSRRWLLFAAQVFRGGGFLVWALFPGFWGYLIGFMLWGVKSALVSGTFEALLYDELKAEGRPQDYARAIGHAQTGRFAGLMSAALIAAAIAGIGNYALTLVSSASSLVGAASALLLPKAPRTAPTKAAADYIGTMRRGLAEAVRRPGVLSILVFIALMQSLLAACDDYWQIFARDVGLDRPQIALFVAALGAGQAGAAAVAHRAPLRRSWSLPVWVAAGGLVLTTAAAVFRPVVSVPLAVLFTAMCIVALVQADARFQHALSGEARATVASVKGFASQCAITLLILNFGLMAQASAYRTAFLVHGVALTVLGAGYAAWMLSRRAAA